MAATPVFPADAIDGHTHLMAEPGDDYPVTWIRDRDYVITSDRATLASPANLI